MPILDRFACADQLTYSVVALHAEYNTPITLLNQWTNLTMTVEVQTISRMHVSRARRRWFYVDCKDSFGTDMRLRIEVKSPHCREQKIRKVQPHV